MKILFTLAGVEMNGAASFNNGTSKKNASLNPVFCISKNATEKNTWPLSSLKEF